MKLLLTIAFFLFFDFSGRQTYAILADRLIDTKADQSMANPTIIVYKDRIINVNFKNEVPDSSTTKDLKGCTVLPGMMDVHTHLLSNGGDYNKDLYENNHYEFSEEFENQFRTNEIAWRFFNSLSPSYRKPAIKWVISAKQEVTRMKRLKVLISCSENQRKIKPLNY